MRGEPETARSINGHDNRGVQQPMWAAINIWIAGSDTGFWVLSGDYIEWSWFNPFHRIHVPRVYPKL